MANYWLAGICGVPSYSTDLDDDDKAKNRKNCGDRNEKEVAVHRLMLRLLINLM
jgi:hypothetical protein